MILASEALKRLQEGNQRFLSGIHSEHPLVKPMQKSLIIGGQAPIAIILGCSDARVPAEIVFDQNLGDLFVIRVAGNIVAPSQIGSVEFAAEKFGTPLVIVLGHSMCGAVMATIDDLEHPSNDNSSNMLSIVNRIRPTIEPLFETELGKRPEQLLESAIRANILASTNQLRHGSPMLERLVQQDKLTIIGAEYSLKTGKVDFFHGI